MAAPADGSLILPNDSGNTGDQIRTYAKLISGNTVHEHVFRPSFGVTIRNRYFFAPPQQSVLVAASSPQNGTTTAFFWMLNPSNSAVVSILRRVVFDCNCASASIMATGTVISVTKFTFTGSPSGSAFTSLSANPFAISARAYPVSGLTGGTLTLVAEVARFQLPATETATGVCYGSKEAYPFNPTAYSRGSDIETAPGEGLVFYQSTAGTATTDARRFSVQVVWDEIDP